jgi:excisionase family DNA binding protein
MSAQAIAITPVPSQRLFGTKSAAQYLGIHVQTLRKLTDLGEIPARRMGSRRVFRLEDLNEYIDSLPQWYDHPDKESGTERRNHGH